MSFLVNINNLGLALKRSKLLLLVGLACLPWLTYTESDTDRIFTGCLLLNDIILVFLQWSRKNKLKIVIKIDNAIAGNKSSKVTTVIGFQFMLF